MIQPKQILDPELESQQIDFAFWKSDINQDEDCALFLRYPVEDRTNPEGDLDCHN